MMQLSSVALWTRGHLAGADVTVSSVAIDTRKVKPGDLFVAFKGEHVDGHDYLAQAHAAGAVAALVAHKVASPLPQVLVENVEAALGDLASAVRAQRTARVIGITGSNGKTTVKTLTASILALHGRTHATQGSLNNEIGLPLTLLAMPADTEYAVLEMGAGKPGDIAYLAAIARPDIGLVNLIAPAHLERMGSVEVVAETKGAMYQALPADGVAIINADDAFAGFFAGLAGTRRTLHFGLDHKADVGADIVQERVDGSLFLLSTPVGDAEVNLALPGRHNVMNAMAAAGIALALDVPLTTIVAGLEQARAVPGRLRRMPMAGGWTLIDDSYNANPSSMAAAITTLALAGGERWLVIGDMGELGPDERALHVHVGEQARAAGIERLFAVGPLSAGAVAAFGANAEHFVDRAALTAALKGALHAGVTCLVKGSHAAGMSQVVKALEAAAGTEGTTDAA